MRFVSLNNYLHRYNGIGPGFDNLRFGLAVSIVFIHCFLLANGSSLVLGDGYAPGATAATIGTKPQQWNALGYLVPSLGW